MFQHLLKNVFKGQLWCKVGAVDMCRKDRHGPSLMGLTDKGGARQASELKQSSVTSFVHYL